LWKTAITGIPGRRKQNAEGRIRGQFWEGEDAGDSRKLKRGPFGLSVV